MQQGSSLGELLQGLEGLAVQGPVAWGEVSASFVLLPSPGQILSLEGALCRGAGFLGLSFQFQQ